MGKYSDSFRADCVLMLEAAGYPSTKGAITAVSRRVKVPRQTLERWYRKTSNPPPPEIVHEKKKELIDQLKDLLQISIEHATKEAPDANYRELATGIGIITDKIQLLENKPTSIVDNVNPIVIVKGDEWNDL